MHGRRRVVFWALFISLFGSLVGGSPEDKLIDWILANGGSANIMVGPVSGGIRGIVATQNFFWRSTIAHIPRKMTIPLGNTEMSAAENAIELLKLLHGSPDWNATFGRYWATLPAQGSLQTKEVFTDEDVALLQDVDLAREVLEDRVDTRNAYYGNEEMEIPPLHSFLPAGVHVDFDQFVHLTALVSTYTYSWAHWETGEVRRTMIPLLDLINHAGPATANANVKLDLERGGYVLTARRWIRPGDEITFTYNLDMERNDLSLLHHGFIQIPKDGRPALLCDVDLPHHLIGPLHTAHLGSDRRYGFFGEWATSEELQRLSARLASFPTTQEEDAQLLEGGTLTKPLHRLIVEFRRERKRSLAHIIDKLKRRKSFQISNDLKPGEL